MVEAGSRIQDIEAALPTIDAGGLQRMLQELDSIEANLEADPNAELTDFYRVQDLRTEITARLAEATQAAKTQEPQVTQVQSVQAEQPGTQKHGINEVDKAAQITELTTAINSFDLNRNYYEILGVDVDATPEQIKAAYRKLVQKFHYDKLSMLGVTDSAVEKKAKEIVQMLNEAYAVLSNPDERKKYKPKGEPAAPSTGESLQNIETENLVNELAQKISLVRMVEILKELTRREYVFTYSVTHSGVTFEGKTMSAHDFCELVADANSKLDASEFVFNVAVNKIPPILGMDVKIKAALTIARFL